MSIRASLVVRLGALSMLALCTARPASAQFTSDNCTVSVLNRSVRVNSDGSWVLPNIPANFGLVRARVTCIVDGQTISGESEPFLVPANGVVNLPHINFGATTPIPTSLTVTAAPAALTQAGGIAQLTTTAHYSDGTTKDVTAASTGTQYTISNSAIATISTDGVVTSVQSGTVLIQATQEGASGIASVQVVLDGESHQGIPDSWAAQYGLNPSNPTLAAEDPDRDGLTNLQEFQFGTNPIVADTDGDNLSDGDEVARGTSPLLRDTDGDGISDGLEVQTGSDPLDPTSFNLAGALSAIAVTPPVFTLTFNTIAGDVSVQLKVTGTLRDSTTIDLTSHGGVNFATSNINSCNFGAAKGRIFAGQAGSCLITITAGGFSTTSSGTVHTFSPTPLSSLELGGSGNGVDVRGDFVYVAVGGLGLRTVDVSNRNAPKVVGTLALLGTANDVKVAGTLAYVAAGAGGLHIVDVSNPLLPRLLGSVDTPGDARRVRLRGNLAFVADGPSGLQIVDITTPTAPRIIGSTATAAMANGLDIIDTLAIVAVDAAGVQIVDVTNPTSPVTAGAVDTPGQALDVVVRGHFAYVADYTGSLRVIDFTTPSAPALGATTPGNLGGYLLSVAMRDSFVFGADIFFVNGVPIVDVSMPSNPIPRAILNFPGDSTGQGIAVDGSYVYLVGSDTRLYIGQYRIQEDLNGVPPIVSIASPGAGATFVENETIPVTVVASDDLAVASVTLLVNGVATGTATASPYQFNITAPVGLSGLTLGASANDLGNNTGVATDTTINVIPDPMTTAGGQVALQDGTLVAGATVTCLGMTGVTLADGSFLIPNVPTTQSSIVCTTKLVSGGLTLSGLSTPVARVRGGITPIGDIIMAPVPVISSITPNVVDTTRPPPTLQVAGANLTGSTFSFVPALVPAAITVGTAQINAAGTSATLPITVASTARGRFTLVGTNAFGGADTTPTASNALTLINGQDDVDSDGDGFPDGLELLFGSDPANPSSIPSLTARGDLMSAGISVVNTAAPAATVQESISAAFSVSNTQLPSSTTRTLVSSALSILNTSAPGGLQSLIGSAFSVLNSAMVPTGQQIVGPAVSVLNVLPGTQLSQQVTLAAANSTQPLSVSLSGLVGGQLLVEGQTVTVGATVGGLDGSASVAFSVNDLPIVTDTSAPYAMTFTVPAGAQSLRFGASAGDGTGRTAIASAIDVTVERDATTSISGRVVDAAGNPARGVVVEAASDGLEAEFFDSVTPLSALPNLTAATPIRTTRVTAVNMRGPNDLFGFDPFGVGLAPDYTARFTGGITISIPGPYTFYLGADEGARLRLRGVTEIDMPTPVIGGYQEKSAIVNLDQGLVPVEITFYESVGNAQLQLSFVPPGGERQVVPPALLVPNPQPFVVMTDEDGRFTIRGIPSALAGIQVRAAVIVNGQTMSAESTRVTPVSGRDIQIGDLVLSVPR